MVAAENLEIVPAEDTATQDADPFIREAPEPGAFLWEKVTSPQNLELLEGDERARKLDKKRLKQLKKRLEKARMMLSIWERKIYPHRLLRLQERIEKLENQPESQRNDENYSLQLSLLRSELTEKQRVPPKKPGFWQKRRERKLQKIRNPKQARQVQLFVHRAEARLKEHEIAVQNELLYKKLAEQMQLEVKFFAEQIVKRWSALQNREEFYVKGKRRIRLVKIEEAHVTEDEIQYKIYVASRTLLGSVKHHLPDDVRAWELVKPETLRELTVACERPVSSPHAEQDPPDFSNGAWVIVYREGMTDGLFDYIPLSKVLAKYNQAHRSKYPAPVGVRRGRVIKWLYLSEVPHLMFNGTTGSGKTNVGRVLLTTWCQFHSPDEIRFALVDLKRGGDLNYFARVPHLIGEIVKDVAVLAGLVPRLVALMFRRMDKFSHENCVDIEHYNRVVSEEERMPRIVLLIDEYGSINDLADSKDQADIIHTAMKKIAAMARAAGIHLALGTQYSSTKSIPQGVVNNITFVLSGRQRTLGGSMGTFGDGRAKKLPNIRGRMWCDDGTDLEMVQTPYADEKTIYRALEIADSYETPRPLELPAFDGSQLELLSAPQLTVNDVIEISINEFNGAMSYRKIYDFTDKECSVRGVRDLIQQIVASGNADYEGQSYEVVKYGSGYKLQVIPAGIHENTESHIPDSVYAADFSTVHTQKQESEA